MIFPEKNRYQFHCEVVEIISDEGKRIVNAMCNPGSIIIEIPDDGQIQLGDILSVSGTIDIDRINSESKNSS